jgi:hypothetical protein
LANRLIRPRPLTALFENAIADGRIRRHALAFQDNSQAEHHDVHEDCEKEKYQNSVLFALSEKFPRFFMVWTIWLM